MAMSTVISYLLTASMLISGGQAVKQANINLEATPVRTYDAQVEGSNAIIYADTPGRVSYFVPDTSWQEDEMKVPEENCTLTLTYASPDVEMQAEQFINGEMNSLTLSSGEYLVVELDGAHWITEMMMDIFGSGFVEVWITDGSGARSIEWIR